MKITADMFTRRDLALIDATIDRQMREATQAYAKAFFGSLDDAIRDGVVAVEGVFPPMDVFVQHAQCAVYPGGRMEYKWRGTTIVMVHPALSDRWAELRFEPPQIVRMA